MAHSEMSRSLWRRSWSAALRSIQAVLEAGADALVGLEEDLSVAERACSLVCAWT